jgi:hypothetical protein
MRYLFWHPESECLFDEDLGEDNAWPDPLVMDVTGEPEWEARFKEQQAMNIQTAAAPAANPTGAQIFELIPKVMADVGAIEKARRNEQQKYFFRGIDDVFAAFQPVLAKHRIFYVPEVLDKEVTERETKSGSTLIYTTLAVGYTFYAPDGSNVRAVVVGEAMDSGDKSSNKAMSAALKYALLQIFCVPTEANEDADAQTHEIKPIANGNKQTSNARREEQDQAEDLLTPAQAGAIRGMVAKLTGVHHLDEGDIRAKIKNLTAGRTDTPAALTNAEAAKVITSFQQWIAELDQKQKSKTTAR